MPQVIVGNGVMPCQIDGFSEKCERSRKGALYIRPRSSLEMTHDELDHIKVTHPELYKKLRVVEQPRKKAPAKPKPEAKTMTAKPAPAKAKASSAKKKAGSDS